MSSSNIDVNNKHICIGVTQNMGSRTREECQFTTAVRKFTVLAWLARCAARMLCVREWITSEAAPAAPCQSLVEIAGASIGWPTSAGGEIVNRGSQIGGWIPWPFVSCDSWVLAVAIRNRSFPEIHSESPHQAVFRCRDRHSIYYALPEPFTPRRLDGILSVTGGVYLTTRAWPRLDVPRPGEP